MSTRATLKSFFETGDKPTQAQFYDLIDSLFHKTEDSVNWTEIAGKPTTFVPSEHTHAWADLTGVPTTFAPSAHTHAWGDLTGIPTTFAPSAHVHSAGEITTGLFHPSRIGAGTTTDGYIVQMVAGVPTWVVAPSGGGSGWGLTGNSGTSAGTNYIGTNDAQSLYFKTNGSTVGHLGAGNGSLMMGLSTNGTATARNTVFGDFAGGGGLSGTDNSAFGRLALYLSSGIGLSAFGQGAGYAATGITGNYLSFFGFETQAESAGLTNATAIGANARIAQSNTVILGNNCDVGIRTKTPSYTLDVNGTTRIVTVPTITTATKMLVKDPTTGQVSEQLIPSTGTGWGLSGNAISSGQFIGTTNAFDLSFKSNNVEFMRLGTTGSIAIGSTASAGIYGGAIGAASFSTNSAYALGNYARAEAGDSLALGAYARPLHGGAVVVNANYAVYADSDRINQIKLVASGGIDLHTSTGSRVFSVLSTGKLAAFGLSTYATEADGLAAEASGVIFKVGNALYHKP